MNFTKCRSFALILLLPCALYCGGESKEIVSLSELAKRPLTYDEAKHLLSKLERVSLMATIHSDSIYLPNTHFPITNLRELIIAGTMAPFMGRNGTLEYNLIVPDGYELVTKTAVEKTDYPKSLL